MLCKKFKIQTKKSAFRHAIRFRNFCWGIADAGSRQIPKQKTKKLTHNKHCNVFYMLPIPLICI